MSKISSKDLGRLRGRLNDQIQFNRELTPAAKNIGYIITSRMMAANGGNARISNTELMALVGCDAESTITRSIQSLREHGHFHIESRCRGDRLFVPIIKKIDVHQRTSKVDADVQECTSKSNEPIDGDVQECTSSHAPVHVATCTPTQEAPAAEGLLKSPSLYPSLNPSLEGAPQAPPPPPVDGKPKRKRSKLPTVATFLPDDWKPSDDYIATAKRHSLTDLDIDRDVVKFRNYFTRIKRIARKDWLATWENWVIGTAETLGRTPTPTHTAAVAAFKAKKWADVDSPQWLAWDRYFKSQGKVGASDTDARPGGPDTRLRRGWYFKEEWPPGYQPEQMAAAA